MADADNLETQGDDVSCNNHEYGHSNFSALQQHFVACNHLLPATCTDTEENALGLKLRVYSEFFGSEDYVLFKRSLFEDIEFVREMRKANQNSVSCTKRIYAIYGNQGTGISYNNCRREATNDAPPCVDILFHYLCRVKYQVSEKTCIMVTCYPPSKQEDIERAAKLNKNTYMAMSFHADDNTYLGDKQQVQVLTISGFLDPKDVDAPVKLFGWNFIVKNSSDRHYVSLIDNMLLVQPEGMQAIVKHGVQGVRSPYVRWVITVRDIDKDKLQASSTHAEIIDRRGVSLREWCKGKPLQSWASGVRPMTHAMTRKMSQQFSPLAALYPSPASYRLHRLLLCNVLYCATCTSIVLEMAHDCVARNNVVFGHRHDMTVGTVYSVQALALLRFAGSDSLDSSFYGAVEHGCFAIRATKAFPGNDWANWKLGLITIGGSGGRECLAGGYSNTSAPMSYRNDMLIVSQMNRLPIQVIVEHDEGFMYIGSWYVINTSISTFGPSNAPFITYRLVSLQEFVKQCGTDPLAGRNSWLELFCNALGGDYVGAEHLTTQGELNLKKVLGMDPLPFAEESQNIDLLATWLPSFFEVFGVPLFEFSHEIILECLNEFLTLS